MQGGSSGDSSRFIGMMKLGNYDDRRSMDTTEMATLEPLATTIDPILGERLFLQNCWNACPGAFHAGPISVFRCKPRATGRPQPVGAAVA